MTTTKPATAPPASNGTAAPRAILAFSAANGWTQTTDPVPPVDRDADTCLRRAGWLPIGRFGAPGDDTLAADLHQRDGEFLVGISTPITCTSVLCRSMPDVLALLGQVLPTIDLAKRLDNT